MHVNSLHWDFRLRSNFTSTNLRNNNLELQQTLDLTTTIEVHPTGNIDVFNCQNTMVFLTSQLVKL